MIDKALAKNIWKIGGLFCCLFSTAFLSLFSLFLFLFSFLNNIYRGVQNKIRIICNKEQLFILLLTPPPLPTATPCFSIQIFHIFLSFLVFTLIIWSAFFNHRFFFDLPVITSISLNNMLMLLFHGLTNLNSVDLFPSKGNLAYPHHSPSLPISSQYRYGTSRSSSIYKFN